MLHALLLVALAASDTSPVATPAAPLPRCADWPAAPSRPVLDHLVSAHGTTQLERVPWTPRTVMCGYLLAEFGGGGLPGAHHGAYSLRVLHVPEHGAFFLSYDCGQNHEDAWWGPFRGDPRVTLAAP